MQIILNAILVIITGVYAVLTRRIAKSNESTVAAMNSQIKSTTRPYITITLSQSSQTTLRMRIANTGMSNAENLRLQIDKDFFQFGRKEDNLADVYVFKNPIPSFPPRAQLEFPLLSSLEVQDDKSSVTSEFTITATYSFNGEPFTERTTIDLKMYKDIWMPTKTVQEELSELTTEIKELKEVLKKKFAS
ncbi:MAG: hypothetical protein ABSA44_12710 [Bacteroidota bacterium]